MYLVPACLPPSFQNKISSSVGFQFHANVSVTKYVCSSYYVSTSLVDLDCVDPIVCRRGRHAAVALLRYVVVYGMLLQSPPPPP